MAKRGQLTEQIKAYSKMKMGYEIGVSELRLMPYIQYYMMNSHKLDSPRLNDIGIGILDRWQACGYITGPLYESSGLHITKDFWDIICEICYMGYVDID